MTGHSPFTTMAGTEGFEHLLCLPCHLYGPLEVHHLPYLSSILRSLEGGGEKVRNQKAKRLVRDLKTGD